MEYVDGEDLASLLKRIGRLPPDKALEIARELCAGLAAAHDQGVLHRDLKPANVMIDGRGRARITDFGLAVAAGEVVEGEVSGTPAYMAPEQLAGKGASVRSDLYALGLVLYELFTGTQGLRRRDARRSSKRKHSGGSRRPRRRRSRPGFDPAVERVILRCLEKDPAARPASAAQVAAALPGGDPLAAALAAGETPSPEMVAAAGEEGALAPAKAWTLLGRGRRRPRRGRRSSRASRRDQGVAPFPEEPGRPSTDRARELVRSCGYTVRAGGRGLLVASPVRLPDLSGRARSLDQAGGELARAEPHPWSFGYRQSPRSWSRPLGTRDPADGHSSARGLGNGRTLALDARGNLMRLSRRAAPGRGGPGRRAPRRPGLEAALRRGRPGLRAVHAVAAALAAERALRRARGLGRRLRREPPTCRSTSRPRRGAAGRSPSRSSGPGAARAHAGEDAGRPARVGDCEVAIVFILLSS